MRFPGFVITVAVALSALACSSSRYQTDFDQQADFSHYSSFAWYQMAEADKGPTEGPSQIIDQRIRSAIADILHDRGFGTANSSNADLLVTYYTSLSPQTRFHTTAWGVGWGWGPGWGFGYGYWPGWTTTTVQTFHEGTVIIDIIDREKNQLVWRGVSTRTLGKKSHSDEKIQQSMARLFAEFPPTGLL
jgi:hypothetical protein